MIIHKKYYFAKDSYWPNDYIIKINKVESNPKTMYSHSQI